ATRHWVTAHLDDASIRAGPLGRPLYADPFQQPTDLHFDIDRAVFATSDEVADKIADTRALGQQRIGQIENSLEIQVPRSEPQLAIKHRDTITHIVKRDAQFGLALADLVQ